MCSALDFNYLTFSTPTTYMYRLLTNSTCFGAWEGLVNEVEREARSCSQLAQKLQTSVSQQLCELTARKKHLIKKVSIHCVS